MLFRSAFFAFICLTFLFTCAVTISSGKKLSASLYLLRSPEDCRYGCEHVDSCVIANLNFSVAEIKITLHNEGADAYHPDVYGGKILIERRLTSSGGSDYKLKSTDGENAA